MCFKVCVFFFSSRRRHTRWTGDWSSDVCSSDLSTPPTSSKPWQFLEAPNGASRARTLKEDEPPLFSEVSSSIFATRISTVTKPPWTSTASLVALRFAFLTHGTCIRGAYPCLEAIRTRQAPRHRPPKTLRAPREKL